MLAHLAHNDPRVRTLLMPPAAQQGPAAGSAEGAPLVWALVLQHVWGLVRAAFEWLGAAMRCVDFGHAMVVCMGCIWALGRVRGALKPSHSCMIVWLGVCILPVAQQRAWGGG